MNWRSLWPVWTTQAIPRLCRSRNTSIVISEPSRRSRMAPSRLASEAREIAAFNVMARPARTPPDSRMQASKSSAISGSSSTTRTRFPINNVNLAAALHTVAEKCLPFNDFRWQPRASLARNARHRGVYGQRLRRRWLDASGRSGVPSLSCSSQYNVPISPRGMTVNNRNISIVVSQLRWHLGCNNARSGICVAVPAGLTGE